MNWLTRWIISSLLNDNYFNRVIDLLDLFTVRLGSSMSWTLTVSSYVIKYGWNVKMQHWLNEVLIIGNNYHKRFRDFNYALEFVVGGLMRFI